MENLVLCKLGGDWVAGMRRKQNNVELLDSPRIYLFNGQQHGFMNLPGDPANIQMDGAYFWYPIGGEMADLYQMQVSKIKRAPAGLILPV